MPDKVINVKKTTLPITGMTCASCVSHVEKVLRALDGVISVNVNLVTERAIVEYDADKRKWSAAFRSSY